MKVRDINLSYYFSVQSTHLIENNETMIITFSKGNAVLLNLFKPQTMYLRDTSTQKSTTKTNSQINVNSSSEIERENNNEVLFAQPSGKIIQIKENVLLVKSAWEFFIVK